MAELGIRGQLGTQGKVACRIEAKAPTKPGTVHSAPLLVPLGLAFAPNVFSEIERERAPSLKPAGTFFPPPGSIPTTGSKFGLDFE